MSKSIILLWLVITCSFLIQTAVGLDKGLIGDAAFWTKSGRDELELTLSTVNNLYNGKAKNVILVIGAGMDVTSLMVAGYVKTNNPIVKKQEKLFIEKFRHSALARVYSADFYTTDASAAITALTTGIKTRNKVLGYGPSVIPGDCGSITSQDTLTNMFAEAKASGRSVGLVTTGEVTNPTIAAAYARTPDSSWVKPGSVPSSQQSQGCKDIITQFEENGTNYDVIFGGGRKPLEENDSINKWKQNQETNGRNLAFVNDKAGLQKIDTSTKEYALGLFSDYEMAYDLERKKSAKIKNSEPSLKLMVTKALEILSKNKDGYFMMIDAANIDKAHRHTMTKYAVGDIHALDESVKYVKENTNPEETLIVVTSNYGYTTTVGNNITRGIDILGFLKDGTRLLKGTDEQYYTAIGYGSGPIERNNKRFLNEDSMKKDDYQYQATVPMDQATTGGQHVAVFSDGVKAHTMTTLLEQFDIYNSIMNAACLDYYANRSGC